MTVGYLGLPVDPVLEWTIVIVGVVLPAAAGAVFGSTRSRRLRFAAVQAILTLTLAWVVIVGGTLGWGGVRAIYVLLVTALPPALFFGCRALAAWLRRRADAATPPPNGPP